MTVTLPPGRVLRVPTAEEMLRVKAVLVLERNQVRDFLDVVALADRLGRDDAGRVLTGIDDYDVDRSDQHGSVLTALVLALADPRPSDAAVIDGLDRYRGPAPRLPDWAVVVGASRDLAALLAGDG